MTANDDVLPLVLTAYSIPHAMGYLPTLAGDRNPNPITLLDLVSVARGMGLAGVEVPLSSVVPSFGGALVEVGDQAREMLAELKSQGMCLVADYGIITDHDQGHLEDYLRLASASGAKVVRAVLSSVLCGERAQVPEGWDARLNAVAARLCTVLPLAEDLGVALAVENHQDATTADMLRLYEQSGQNPAFGVTLDTGNPLAVCEDPLQTAVALAPVIRHIHLKDYTIHYAPEGYRLVRCIAGRGVIDFRGILDAVSRNGHEILPGIEVAAQATRTIPFLRSSWWDTFPNADPRNLVAALQTLWEKGRPAHEAYSSAWERGEDSAVVRAEEWRVLRESAEYFTTTMSG